MKHEPRTIQGELSFPHRHGGARVGAGRPKKKGWRRRAPHAKRAAFSRHDPLHVTIRLRGELPGLRNSRTHRALRECFGAGKERFGFRLVHYAVLSNHLHLIVEAENRGALSRGMKGLLVRTARALNRLWKRTGSVFAERFHDHVLKSLSEVRRALVYVLNNARRHGIRLPPGVPDLMSSGPNFDGWRDYARYVVDRDEEHVVASAATWRLSVGWRRLGLLSTSEVPCAFT